MTLLEALHGLTQDDAEMLLAALGAIVIHAAGEDAPRIVTETIEIAVAEGVSEEVISVLAGVLVAVAGEGEPTETRVN